MFEKRALSGLKVVEYAHFISGPYCAKLLADLGAEVIKVEEPGVGDVARRAEPFLDDIPHLERSGLFLYLNTNKLGMTLNLKNATGLMLLKELLRQADVFVENSPPMVAKDLGIDYESLKRVNPKLIVTSITPFGQTGPYRDYKATDLISAHMGGLAWLTPCIADDPASKPPLRPGGRQTDFVAGATGALATLFAVFARLATGEGQHVDVSEQEAIASFVRMEIAFYTHDPNGAYKWRFAKRAPFPYPVDFMACKDGYVVLGNREAYHWRPFMEEVLGPGWHRDVRLKGLVSDPESLDPDVFRTRWPDVFHPIVQEWAMKHTKDEIFHMAQARRLPITACNTMDEATGSPQVVSREFLVDIEHPEAGKVSYPGALFKLDGTPWQVRRPAPRLGEHNEEVLCRQLGYSKQDLVKLREAGVI